MHALERRMYFKVILVAFLVTFSQCTFLLISQSSTGGTIVVVVKDISGAPIQGARVRLYSESNLYGTWWTDSGGSVAISVSSGTYTSCVDYTRYAFIREDVNVSDGETVDIKCDASKEPPCAVNIEILGLDESLVKPLAIHLHYSDLRYPLDISGQQPFYVDHAAYILLTESAYVFWEEVTISGSTQTIQLTATASTVKQLSINYFDSENSWVGGSLSWNVYLRAGWIQLGNFMSDVPSTGAEFYLEKGLYCYLSADLWKTDDFGAVWSASFYSFQSVDVTNVDHLVINVGGPLYLDIRTDHTEYYPGEKVCVWPYVVDNYGHETRWLSKDGSSVDFNIKVFSPSDEEILDITVNLYPGTDFYTADEQEGSYNIDGTVDTGPFSGMLTDTHTVETMDLPIISVKNTHQGLVEVFTASWCGPCKNAAPSIEHLQLRYGHRFNIIAFHVWGSGEGQLATSYGDARAEYYEVTGIPTLIFDGGRDKAVGAGTVASTEETYSTLLTDTLISSVPQTDLSIVENTIDTQMNIGGYVENIDEVELENIRLVIYVVEDKVSYENYHYDNVFRAIVFNQTINLLSGQRMNFTTSWACPEDVNVENCHATAVIFDSNGLVLQSARTDKVTILVGDVNGDGIVDIFDVVILAKAFGSKPEDPDWNQAADLNNDDVVDIFDVVTIAKNFGKTLEDP